MTARRLGCANVFGLAILCIAGLSFYSSHRFDAAVVYVQSRDGYVDWEGSGPFRYCTHVDWAHCNVSDREMKHLVALAPGSIRLDGNPRVTDEGLRALCQLPECTTISVRKTSVTLAGVRHCRAVSPHRSIPAVVHSLVDLEANGGSTADLEQAARYIWKHYVGVETDARDRVVELSLREKHVDRQFLELIPAFHHLERIGLPGKAISDSELQLICRCRNLTSLPLDQSRVTALGFKAVSNLPRLTTLYLRQSTVTDDAICQMERLPALSHLYLEDTAITGVSLEHLSQFPRIEKLDLRDTQISNDGIKALLRFPRLVEVDLDRTAVTDSCIPDLAQIQTLCRVSFFKTSVSEAAVERLGKKLGLQRIGKALVPRRIYR